MDGQVDVLEHMERTEPFVDTRHLDHDVLGDGHGLGWVFELVFR